jgi:hypothetical protein
MISGNKFKFGCLVGAVLIIFTLSLGVYLWENRSPLVKKIAITEIWDNTEFLNQLSNLELAERNTTEKLEQKEIKEFSIPFYKWFTVKSEADYSLEFNVLYTYTVSSEREKWKIRYRGEILFIDAPPIELRPPAIDTGSIKAFYSGGYLITKEKAKLDEMKKTLSKFAFQRGISPNAVNIVREPARESVEKFFYSWFFRDKTLKLKNILVKFPDEKNFRNY